MFHLLLDTILPDTSRKPIIQYSILEFGIPIKLGWLIKMCLNETKIHIGTNFSDNFPIQNDKK
jgi:hypothetical protein